MAGGDAFFEEGIHWLHIAGSLGPRIVSIDGYRPSVSTEGPDKRAKSMMVAFRYDNNAVGSLYYSREIPSLFKGLRLSKLYGRKGIITFESNGLFVLARGNGVPRLVFPGLRDIRGYQAMYRDFHAAITNGRAPEMSLERAMEDQRLMDDVCSKPPTCGLMPHERYDIVIIGSGAGGGTIAHALSGISARVLILERGGFVPQEDENWNPEAVWKHLRYQTNERWIDGEGREFRPYTHYNVGGNTKFWGSVLYPTATRRLPRWSSTWTASRRHGRSTMTRLHPSTSVRSGSIRSTASWAPIQPSRTEAFPYPPIPHSEEMAAIVQQLRAQGLHPSPLPLGIRDGCILCDTCNSFACAKSTRRARPRSVVCFGPRAAEHSAVDQCVCTAPHHQCGWHQARAVEVEKNGQPIRVESSLFVVSCGAVNSAALLLRSTCDKHPQGLANSSGLVGRRYMAHLATMMQGFHPFRKNTTVFQKTVAINDFYLRGPGALSAGADSISGPDAR